jgi:hypothetical protein
MTTRVDIFAGHGWPVDVTPINRPGGERGATTRIAANTQGTAYVHSGQDLLIREVETADLEAEAAPADPEPAPKKGK